MTEAPRPRYFPVSAQKLVVMSVASFGIYGIYWFYQQWAVERAHTGEDLSPFWRTVFAPVWIYALLLRVRAGAQATDVSPRWSATTTAAAYIALNLVWLLPLPYALVGVLAAIPLIPVQGTINGLNAGIAPDAPRNDTYTGRNVVLIVVGILLYVLVIVGMTVPIENDSYTSWVVA